MCAPQANAVIHANDSLSLKVCTMGWAIGWVSVIHELFKICFLDHGSLRVLYNTCDLCWFSKLDVWGAHFSYVGLKSWGTPCGARVFCFWGRISCFWVPSLLCVAVSEVGLIVRCGLPFHIWFSVCFFSFAWCVVIAQPVFSLPTPALRKLFHIEL